ncbi:MAG: ferrous iron transporter B, partial [Bacillota bacterium]
MRQTSLFNGLDHILREVNNLNPNGSLKINDSVVSKIYHRAEEITQRVVTQEKKPRVDWDKKLD